MDDRFWDWRYAFVSMYDLMSQSSQYKKSGAKKGFLCKA